VILKLAVRQQLSGVAGNMENGERNGLVREGRCDGAHVIAGDTDGDRLEGTRGSGETECKSRPAAEKGIVVQ
jgi:hypothetical protein